MRVRVCAHAHDLLISAKRDKGNNNQCVFIHPGSNRLVGENDDPCLALDEPEAGIMREREISLGNHRLG